GPPTRRWAPSPTTRSSLTRTAPTAGFGDVRPIPRSATRRARSIHSASRSAATTGSRHRTSGSGQRVDVHIGVERCEIVGLLPRGHELDRHTELAVDADDYSAL